MNKIFNLYFTSKKEGVGTGLGLAIVKNIIEDEHYGKIFVKSEIGMGSTFIVQLPFIRKKPLDRIAALD